MKPTRQHQDTESTDRPQDTKITVKLIKSMDERLEQQLKRLCIKRDPYLDAILAAELPRVSEDLKGLRQSDAATRYIGGELKRQGLVQVTVKVRKSTADLLTRVTEEHNLHRDAFINRLISMLRGGTKTMEALGLDSDFAPYPEAMGFQRWLANYDETALSSFDGVHAWTGNLKEQGLEADELAFCVCPLRAMTYWIEDPFRHLRAQAWVRHGKPLYAIKPKTSDIFLACYLEDRFVPNSSDYEPEQPEPIDDY